MQMNKTNYVDTAVLVAVVNSRTIRLYFKNPIIGKTQSGGGGGGVKENVNTEKRNILQVLVNLKILKCSIV